MTLDQLLPRPTHLTLTTGVFTLDAATAIVVPATPSAAMLHTAKSLQSAIREFLGVKLAIVPTNQPSDANTIVLDLEASSSDKESQGYSIVITPNQVAVRSGGESGLFYGVQTLIQVARLSGRQWPGVSIEDEPVLPVRGLMLDVSRGRVPTIETLIDLVKTLAHYKFNHLQLYMEHTFLFPRHPAIGANAGALTPDEVLTLDAICREHHIELVPNLQSIGHQQAMLKLPQYEHLAETDWKWSLATVQEETFDLLDELYDDLLSCFSSKSFNVNADEPWDIGLGQSRAMTEREGVGRVYFTYVLRLYDLVTRRGHRMIMWADVLKHHPDLIGELPEDILLIDWSYESVPKYETLDALQASGRTFWISPATSSWTTLFPRMENAVANTRDYVQQGIAAGASGMLLTEWGDGGHYQMPSNSWYLYLWGAEVGWNGGTTERDAFDAGFDRLFLADGSGAVTAALRRLGETTQTAFSWLTTWNTAMALLEEPLVGSLSETVPMETVAATRVAADALDPLLDRVRDAEIRYDLGFTVAQIRFATDKIETTRAIHTLMADLGNDPALTEIGKERFDGLIATMRSHRNALPALIAEFETRWYAHSKPSEIRINLDRFAALQAQYDHALGWLARQRAAYERGEAIDSTFSTYDRGDYAVIHEATRRWLMELVSAVGYEALPPDLQEWLGPQM